MKYFEFLNRVKNMNKLFSSYVRRFFFFSLPAGPVFLNNDEVCLAPMAIIGAIKLRYIIIIIIIDINNLWL